jgi:hypothetical protein
MSPACDAGLTASYLASTKLPCVLNIARDAHALYPRVKATELRHAFGVKIEESNDVASDDRSRESAKKTTSIITDSMHRHITRAASDVAPSMGERHFITVVVDSKFLRAL